MHHRLVEARLAHAAVAPHLHVAAEAQAVDLRIERADAVAQGLRQHRHHEAGEIHRGRAQLRLVVERRARPHVVRDVGDRDDEAEPVLVGFAPDRIVEILGILAVDGHQRHAAQVDPAGDVRRLHLQRHGSGLRQHLGREFVRDVVAVDRGLHRLRGGQFVAQHRQHAADRRPVRIGRGGDLGHHQLPGARAVARILRDHHVALDALVVRHHVADAEFFRITAEQAGQPALEDLDDARLAAPAPIHPSDRGEHAIAMGDLAHFVGRQEQVVAALLRAQEAEAVRIGDDRAGDEVGARRGHVAAAAVLQQLALAQHRRQPFLQGVEAIRRVQGQLGRQCLGIHRAIRRGEDLQDHLAAGDRVGVTLRLALGMGIVAGRAWRLRTGALAGRGSRQVGHPRRTLACRCRARALAAAGLGRIAARTGAIAAGTLAAAAAALARGFAHAAMVNACACTPRVSPRALTSATCMPRMRGSERPGGGIGRRTSFRY